MCFIEKFNIKLNTYHKLPEVFISLASLWVGTSVSKSTFLEDKASSSSTLAIGPQLLILGPHLLATGAQRRTIGQQPTGAEAVQRRAIGAG